MHTATQKIQAKFLAKQSVASLALLSNQNNVTLRQLDDLLNLAIEQLEANDGRMITGIATGYPKPR